MLERNEFKGVRRILPIAVDVEEHELCLGGLVTSEQGEHEE
jgi:hypothetical protein